MKQSLPSSLGHFIEHLISITKPGFPFPTTSFRCHGSEVDSIIDTRPRIAYCCGHGRELGLRESDDRGVQNMHSTSQILFSPGFVRLRLNIKCLGPERRKLKPTKKKSTFRGQNGGRGFSDAIRITRFDRSGFRIEKLDRGLFSSSNWVRTGPVQE